MVERRRIATALALVLAGCTVGPDYIRPLVPEPGAYREPAPTTASIANTPWWELFEDPDLRDLVDASLRNNRDLRAAVARIDEAAAVLGIVRADLYPRVFYGGDAAVFGTTAEDGDVSEGSVFLSAGWQIDLWGRFRRANEAALQELLATEESYRGVTLSLVSSVATTYLLLRDLDARLEISKRTVEIRRGNLDIIQARFRGGSVSEIDLNQAQIQLAQAEVAVQAFERLRRQTENGLSLLLGEPPGTITRGRPLREQAMLPDIPSTGLPSELLDRRPDILIAERQLHAQTARIGVAEALKYPQFDLTGSLGASFGDISAGFANLGALLFGPLFNSGENQRRVDAEMARTTQLLNRYEQSILNAYREVEDALVAVRTYRAEFDARLREVAAAESAAELSWIRYEDGVTSYLEVLESQRALFDSQLATSETQQLALGSVVDLYAALGGGWQVREGSASGTPPSPTK